MAKAISFIMEAPRLPDPRGMPKVRDIVDPYGDIGRSGKDAGFWVSRLQADAAY
ncbi:hypothetical protein MOV65_26430 [Neorhizobium sp. SHOUNA12B]|nr:hypothetical protein [Neorhizobium sp. SHOUNA12B]